MDLTDFLLERIDEDEEAARAAAGWTSSGRDRATGRWARTGIASVADDEGRLVVYSDAFNIDRAHADHIARHDPARVLSECEAKRRAVEEHASHGGYGTACQTCARWDDLGHDPWPCATLRLLALPYADHPDYDTAWRVDDDEG